MPKRKSLLATTRQLKATLGAQQDQISSQWDALKKERRINSHLRRTLGSASQVADAAAEIMNETRPALAAVFKMCAGEFFVAAALGPDAEKRSDP